MYSVKDLLKAVKQPNKALRELNRLVHTRFYTRDFNTQGSDVVKEDWDNLLILDASRFDMFQRENQIKGELEEKTSRGASTIEFLKGNFRDRKLQDIVYLTANPQFTWNYDDLRTEFFKVIDLWEEDDYWSDKHNTVPPEKVTEKAKEVSEKYPDKRLIIHYMQPHFPFLPYNEEETREMELGDMFWNQLAKGDLKLSKEEIWKPYNNNLKRALDSVENLLPELRGKAVITSDHGNFVGERASPIPVKEWGHPIGIYDETLVKVPWLVIDSDERKSIVAEEPEKEEKADVDEEAVKEKLQALGYNE